MAVRSVPDARTSTPQQLQSVRATLRSPRRLKTEALAGLVVALALIPEAIAFSVIAGVDPRIGLFASFIMAVTISFVGGRPAMISAATGAVALVIAPLMRSHGLDHLIAAVILAGVFQILLAVLGVTRLMRFIPRSVMVGFVNALAILVFMAQIPELIGVPWMVYPLVAVGLVIVVGLPRITTAVPSPLVAIVVLTLFAVLAGVDVPTVQDKGQLPESLPSLFIPNVPADVGDVPGHCAVLAVDGPGGAAGIADDRQAGGRHHGHPLQQDPRVLGPGRGEHRHRASSAAWAAAP